MSLNIRTNPFPYLFWALGFILGAASMIAASFWYDLPHDPVVRYMDDFTVIPEPVCAGDVITQTVAMEISKPSVVMFTGGYYRVTPDGGDRATGLNGVPVPVPFSGVFTDTIPWTVPALQPGEWDRVTASVPLGLHAEAAFRTVRITIAEDCD